MVRGLHILVSRLHVLLHVQTRSVKGVVQDSVNCNSSWKYLWYKRCVLLQMSNMHLWIFANITMTITLHSFLGLLKTSIRACPQSIPIGLTAYLTVTGPYQIVLAVSFDYLLSLILMTIYLFLDINEALPNPNFSSCHVINVLTFYPTNWSLTLTGFTNSRFDHNIP